MRIKKKARKLRKNRLKITDPSGAEGVTKYPFHHIRQNWWRRSFND